LARAASSRATRAGPKTQPAGNGARLVFTEQAVFLDGYDDVASRERGTRDLLRKLNALK